MRPTFWFLHYAPIQEPRSDSFKNWALGYYLPIVSTPLCFEYEDVLHRLQLLHDLAAQEIDDFLDYFLSESVECKVHFLWRPYLPDQKDDMILELASAGSANCIITHNTRDFRGADAFGIRVMTPAAF